MKITREVSERNRTIGKRMCYVSLILRAFAIILTFAFVPLPQDALFLYAVSMSSYLLFALGTFRAIGKKEK